jgi:hypothetical protein
VLKRLRIQHVVHPHATIALIEDCIHKLNLCVVDYQAWGKSGREFKTLEAGHYSVIFGFNRTHFFVADPAKRHTRKRATWGFRLIQKDLFRKRWADREATGEKTWHWMIAVPLVQCTR